MSGREEKKILTGVYVDLFNSFRVLPEEQRKETKKTIDRLIEVIDSDINERKKRNESSTGGIIPR